MKRYIINFIIIGRIITLLSSCKDKPQNMPCQIIVYDEASTTKAYLISYNGKDSIETICGRLSFDIIRRLHYNQKINMKEVTFRTIYLKNAQNHKSYSTRYITNSNSPLFVASDKRYHPYFGKRCYISIYCIRKSTHQST